MIIIVLVFLSNAAPRLRGIILHMPSLVEIQNELDAIKDRNKRVEMDKAWETSWTRRFIILVLTYSVVVIFFVFAGLSRPFVNAIVPSLAFVLSTVSVPFFKKWWLRNFVEMK